MLKGKIITVLGPTAIGKSDLAVNIARYLQEKYNVPCEVISADSRQIYRYLDLGTGKITHEEMRGIPHHMLDVRDPDQSYSVFEYATEANIIIADLLSRGIMPVICGGTGLYIDALLFGGVGAEAKQNPELREQLEKETLEHLQTRLKEMAEKDKADISKIDMPNKRRVIRAIEILTELKTIPEKKYVDQYDNIIIGLDTDPDFLKHKIQLRIDKRIEAGMIQEVEKLLQDKKIDHGRLQKLGLEYKCISDHLTGILTLKQFKEKLYIAICQYARRQRTWFVNNKNIKDEITWFDIQDADFVSKVETFIQTSI